MRSPADVRCRGGHLSFHSRLPLASLGHSDGAWNTVRGALSSPPCLPYDSAEPHAEQVVSHCPVNTLFCLGAFASAGPPPRGLHLRQRELGSTSWSSSAPSSLGSVRGTPAPPAALPVLSWRRLVCGVAPEPHLPPSRCKALEAGSGAVGMSTSPAADARVHVLGAR